MDFIGKHFFRHVDAPPAPPQPVAILRYVGGLIFDAVFEESHDSELEVTDNPVETGVVVSDHAYMKPLRLKITAGVSDTPLLQSDADMFSQGESRSKQAFEMLSALQRVAEPFDVQTGLRLYENMVCTSIRTIQDKETANSFVFTADLREVIIVNTQTVEYPPRKDKPTKQQADKKKEKGEQQSGDAKPGDKKSVAKSLKDAGSSFFGKGK